MLCRGRGQRRQHREVPEQDLEQQRQVADDLDIGAGDPRHQPVRRQPAERDDETENGGEEDADDRHQERVEQSDQEHAGVGVGARIGNQVLADVKTCRVPQEAEAGGDVLGLEIGAGIDDDLIADPGQQRSTNTIWTRDAAPARRGRRARASA